MPFCKKINTNQQIYDALKPALTQDIMLKIKDLY